MTMDSRRRPFWELQDSRQLVAWLAGLALRGLAEFVWWVPTGVLLALGLTSAASRTCAAGGRVAAVPPADQHTRPADVAKPARRRRARRTRPNVGLPLLRQRLCVAAAAVATGVTLAALLLLAVRGRLVTLDLLLPALGCLLGVWIGAQWRRGSSARRWLPIKLIGLLGATIIVLGVAASLAIEHKPLAFEPAVVTSEEKRRLVALIRSRSPQRLPPGQTQSLRLTAHDLDVLLAWGLSLGSADRKAAVELRDGGATLSASLGLPGGGSARRYVNALLSAQFSMDDGRVRGRATRCRVGDIEVPSWLLALLGPLVESKLHSEPSLRPVFDAVRAVSIAPQSVELTYGRVEFPKSLRADVFGATQVSDEVLDATRAHVRQLLDVAETLPAKDARFGACVETVFQLARQRSANGDPVVENRGAIFALGVLLGHPRIEEALGDLDIRPADQAARQALGRTTLRRRSDWTRHFWVSAALASLSAESVSDAAGLLKEELDAGRGGSGFSFADLLADRAGTTFALVATRDDASAQAIQDRLAAGFDVDDFFPPAADLPERIPGAVLRRRYGGVGGPGYQALIAEIERRVAACAAYR